MLKVWKKNSKILQKFLQNPDTLGKNYFGSEETLYGSITHFGPIEKTVIFENFMGPQNLKNFKIFVFSPSKFKISKIGRRNFCDSKNCVCVCVKNRPFGHILNPHYPLTPLLISEIWIFEFSAPKMSFLGPRGRNFCHHGSAGGP